MKTNLTISRSTDIKKTYPICNDGDIYIAKNTLDGYVENTIFICTCFSDATDPRFHAVIITRVGDHSIRARCDTIKINKSLVDKFYGSITITSNNE
jgi:hypothetical protein